jgi:hypothetical protein
MSDAARQTEVRLVPLGSCEVIYRDAQRDKVNERTVNDIIDSFDPHALGFPFVAKVNGGDRYHIIDGQNRITALKRMGWEDTHPIAVEVCHVQSKAEAAHLFDLRNTFRAPSAVDRFVARVTAGRPDESAVYELVHAMGYSIGSYAGPSVLSAVTALIRAYTDYGEDALHSALAAISATWRADTDRTRGEIIEAWARMFGLYGDIVNPKRLADRVSKKYTAGNLIAMGRTNRQVFGESVMRGVLRATVVQYNAGLRVNARIELD